MTGVPVPAFVRRLVVGLAALSTAAGAQEATAREDSVTRWKVNLLPVLGSAPETGFQYGVAVFATKPHAVEGTRMSSIVSNAIQTAKGQTQAFVEIDRWTANNDWRFQSLVVWRKFPLPFFGIGDDTEESDQEQYTSQGTNFMATVQRRVGPRRWIVGHVQRTEGEVNKTAPGGLLEPGTITGSRGGRTVIASAGFITDTRDNLFAPTRGQYGEIAVARSADVIGSEFEFTRVRLDTRAYLDLGDGHVVAGQATMQGISGDAPFEHLSQVGSSTVMRGYLPGRFRDNWMAAVQGEFRSKLYRQMGFAVFGGAGFVAPEVSELSSARLLPSVGAGFRYRLDPRTGATIRVDYARGTPGQAGLYVSFSEAF